MFAVMIGIDNILYPYIIQEHNPQINIIKVKSETSSAFWVFKVLINCGKKAAVVKIAAKKPKNSTFIEFMFYKSYLEIPKDLSY